MGYVKGFDGVARTIKNPLEGSVGDVDLDEITSRTVSATGNITAGNLSTTGNVFFSNGSKLSSATWTLVESFENLNNFATSGNSSVTMSQTFNSYATNYNEFLIKLKTVGSNPYNRPSNFTTIALNAVSANERIEIDYAPDLAQGWPAAASDAYAYVVWANLATTGLVIHNSNTGSGDNPSTSLYIYAR
jgi:hypothetical protein